MSDVKGVAAAVLLGGLGLACRADERGGLLHARQAALEREVDGLRAAAVRLERGEAILPPDDVVVAVSDSLVQRFLAAQLPFDAEVQAFKIRLDRAEVAFKGSPAVTLTGSVAYKQTPDKTGVMRAIGALEDVRIDPRTGTLRAQVAVDHIDLIEAAGLESLLSGGTLDELARVIRRHLAGRLPPVEIPVKVQQAISLPAVGDGPVRLAAASMPLEVGVSGIYAAQGVLWVAVAVKPGELVKAGP